MMVLKASTRTKGFLMHQKMVLINAVKPLGEAAPEKCQ
jgi:hypothetical protein